MAIKQAVKERKERGNQPNRIWKGRVVVRRSCFFFLSFFQARGINRASCQGWKASKQTKMPAPSPPHRKVQTSGGTRGKVCVKGKEGARRVREPVWPTVWMRTAPPRAAREKSIKCSFASLSLSHTHTHSLTHSRKHSLAHSLTHLFTHSLTHLLTHSLTHSLIPHSLLTHSLTRSLTHSLTHSLIHSLTHSLTQSLTHSLR